MNSSRAWTRTRNNSVNSRALCQLSYAGSSGSGYLLGDPRLLVRFWAKIEVDASTDCWLWTAAKNSRGYGQFAVDGRSKSAHRLAYEVLVELIPDGLELDHLCRRRHCCNPGHVEPVTTRVNQVRSPLTCAGRMHCKRGHVLAGGNLYRHPRGNRVCRTCRADYQAKRRRDRQAIAA